MGDPVSNEITQDYSTLEDQVADDLSIDGTSNNKIKALPYGDLEDLNNNENIDNAEKGSARRDKDYNFHTLCHQCNDVLV